MMNLSITSSAKAALLLPAALALATSCGQAVTEDLGGGFRNHGVATPVSNHRGTVATVDGDGKDIVLSWLFDHTGCYALLLVEADTGASVEYPIPFPSGGDCPYASILSTKNKYYTHFNSHFLEFDPVKREFTFFKQTAPQMAMGMTEDDNGVIWSVTYPQSGVVSYNPDTGEFKDYGHVYKQNWSQYQRYVAADDTGWIYFGVGETASQVVTLNPATGEAKPMFAEEERKQGASGYVYRDLDGKVYGTPSGGTGGDWYSFYQGEKEHLGAHETRNPKPIITSSQGLFHRQFPSGRVLENFDLLEFKIAVKDPQSGEVVSNTFTYSSSGAHVMGLAAAADGTIAGGTAFPFRFFAYNPQTDTWVNRAVYGQWNTVTTIGDRYFVGAYSGGHLLEWAPLEEWQGTTQGQATGNPMYLKGCSPDIGRPHCILATPDGKLVIMGGTPEYGYTGGGLLFWDRETKTPTIVKHTEIVPDQSTNSLAALPGNKIIGGTTISPGTGGEVKATEAELYIMDTVTHTVDWHGVVIPGARGYSGLYAAPNGLVYGFAGATFFAFDPATHEVVHQTNLADTLGGPTGGQGPRIFVNGPNGVYVLLGRGIAKLDTDTHELTMVAQSPVGIGSGGDYLDGRIYFISGSSVYSYELPQ